MKLLLRNNATSMQWCLSWYWREWDWYCSPPLCISWHPCPQDVEFTGSEYWKKNASTNRAKRIKTITWHTKSLANLLKLYLQCGDKEASTFTGRWEKAVVSEGQSKNVGHLIKARSKREHRQLSSVEQQWRFTDHLEQLFFPSSFSELFFVLSLPHELMVCMRSMGILAHDLFYMKPHGPVVTIDRQTYLESQRW